MGNENVFRAKIASEAKIQIAKAWYVHTDATDLYGSIRGHPPIPSHPQFFGIMDPTPLLYGDSPG